MAVVASDLKWYGAANHAEDDTSTQGGAIDTAKKIEMVAMAAFDDTLDVLSSNAGDTTQTIVITGRTTAGVITTENYALNGTTPDTGAQTWDYILKVVMSATAAGTVTVRRSGAGATICTLEPGITSVRTLAYNFVSDPSNTKTGYEKVFVKNTNGTDSLTGASITLTVEPTALNDSLIAVETSVNGTGTATNRLTAPSGVGTFRQLGVAEPLPGDTNLDAGEAIGVWWQWVTDIGEDPIIDDVQIKISGGAA